MSGIIDSTVTMHYFSESKQEQNSDESKDPGEVEISDTDDFFESTELGEEKVAEVIIEPVKKAKHVKKKCPKCPKLFYKAHMKRHMKSAHVYKRTFSCTLYKCGKGFTTKKKLEHHVTFDHEENITVPGDRTCPYCKVTYILFIKYVKIISFRLSLNPLLITNTTYKEITLSTARNVR